MVMEINDNAVIISMFRRSRVFANHYFEALRAIKLIQQIVANLNFIGNFFYTLCNRISLILICLVILLLNTT